MEKPSFEVGENERRKIVDGLNSQIVLYKRQLSNVISEKDRLELEKKIKETEETLSQFQNLKPVASILKEEGTNKPLIYYADYLMLDRIIDSQYLLSEGIGGIPAHDEMLFIIIHQVYELWFKQILHEMNGILNIMQKQFVISSELSRVIHHLHRITEILKLLIQQIDVLETMSSMDFMEFRDYLFPASGFQSFQFRLFENILGIDPSKRELHERKAYHTKLSQEHQKKVQESEKGTTFFFVIEKWLERFPFFTVKEFDFIKEYKQSVQNMLLNDKQSMMRNTEPEKNQKSKDGKSEREHGLEAIQSTDDRFRSIFDEEFYKDQFKNEKLRLSFKARQAALIILSYESEPLLYIPNRLLHSLLDIDEYLSEWRFKHMMMTQRMIGSRVGTGGSSGYWYLRATLERSKVFSDIANLSSFLIPRTQLPKLPPDLKANLGFYHEVIEEQNNFVQK